VSIVVCKVPVDWFNVPSVCLYDWQTLITGIAAVVVGGLTVRYLKKQINQADGVAQEERNARLTVARAKLMVPSSRLAEHARTCFDELRAFEPTVTQHAGPANPINIPHLPPNVEGALDALLGGTQDRNAIFAVSAVYGEQQVLGARASDMHENPPAHALSFDYYYMQPIIMHAVAMSLLGYARYENDAVEPITWSDLAASTRSLAPAGALRDRLLAFVEDRSNRKIAIPFAIRQADA
jgi:hypothetical protein